MEAVYEHGVLRPLEPLQLAEHQRVRLTLDDAAPAPLVRPSAEPPQERKAEMEWLAQPSALYAGQWVALDGVTLLAHGPRLAAVQHTARATGVSEPLFAHIPAANEPPFGGW